MQKSIVEFTEAELRLSLKQKAEHLMMSTNDILNEMHRREMRQQARLTLGIGVVATIVAVASVIVAAIK